VHWARPKLVVEVTFLTWTADGLLRQVVYQGLREDKIAE
jgi:ATP-dependent DNA ligase